MPRGIPRYPWGDCGHVSYPKHASVDSFHSDAAVICLGGNSIAGSGPPDLAMVAIDIHRLVARLVQSGARSPCARSFAD